ncbi:hypothetical protein RchiOBHm_Chr1g0334741 [Rosa chinensis]|uniref:Uncharacterized protein n=1 Tax=Rosa chinensis TaxID=74649 RepID=A0A2P6SCC8_ROSCH|nr:hypothetical protein RchiOBHm_Chr1g0334741 [Rosa chinensis]
MLLSLLFCKELGRTKRREGKEKREKVWNTPHDLRFSLSVSHLAPPYITSEPPSPLRENVIKHHACLFRQDLENWRCIVCFFSDCRTRIG